VRSSMHPLWFDPEKHPEKQDLFEHMLKDEMEAVRNGEDNSRHVCTFCRGHMSNNNPMHLILGLADIYQRYAM